MARRAARRPVPAKNTVRHRAANCREWLEWFVWFVIVPIVEGAGFQKFRSAVEFGRKLVVIDFGNAGVLQQRLSFRFELFVRYAVFIGAFAGFQ